MSQMRTITYTVDFNTQGATTGAKKMSFTMNSMEQDSKKAAASFDKLGKSLGKKFKADVNTTVETTKSLSASMRQGFKDAKKTEMAFNSLGNEYKLLSSKVGRTANQQEQLNAIYKLGPTATLSQKKATVELVKAYQLQRDSVSQVDQALRSSTAASKKAEKNYNDLSREFKLLSSRVGRTAEQQEQLNALYRLGSTATLTQKKRTLQLVKAYQLQRAAGANVQKSFRGMRGQMQNFGYQMQDVAVQMQMGTNAMTIFSQQGSQLAAGFGPTGAVVGAGIAFAGMLGSLLIPNLFKSSAEAKKLSDELVNLAKTVGLTENQSKLLVKTKTESLKLDQKKLKSVDLEIKTNEKIKKQLEAQIKDVSKLDDITRSGKGNETDADRAKRNNTVIRMELEKTTNKLLEQRSEYDTLSGSINKQKKEIDLYANAVGQGTDEQKEWADSNKDIAESLSDQHEQLGLANSDLLELNTSKKIAILIEQGAEKAVIDKAIADANALIVAARRTEMEQALSKEIAERSKEESDALRVQNEAMAAERKLLNLRAGLTDSGKLDQLRAQYEEEKSLLAGHKDELEALEQNYERDRLQVSGTAWEKYLDGLKNASMDFEKLSEDMLQGSVEGLSDGLASAIVNADNLGDAFKNTFKAVAEAGISALIQMGVQRLIFSTLDTGLKAKEVVAHTAGEATKVEATLAAKTAGVAAHTAGEATKVEATLAAKTAEVAAHTAGEATKVEATLAAKTVEMGAMKALYLLNVSARGMAETTLGALNAAASTAAIPVVGPALAPAAAAAFTTFGTAQTVAAVSFAGAFDKGGVIPQNQIGIVSEYGDELVDGMLVKGKSGGTRVTGREDTAKLMGGGGNNTFNITSSGNVSPEAIARAVARSLKKPNKVLDTMVYDSVNRGSKNRGKRFA
jgi:hypothetical protein